MTSERSTFSASPGKRCRNRSDDAPVPKSSRCAPTPRRVCRSASRSQRQLRVLRHRGLGDLQPQVARPRAGAASASSIAPGKPGSASWRAETLTRDADAPLRRAPRGLAQHEVPERHDQPRLLGDGDELARLDLPAAQRLEARELAGDRPEDRLEEHLQVLALDRAPQVGLQVQPVEHLAVHPRVEDRMARLALGLRAVHRDVGVADQLLRDRRPARRARCRSSRRRAARARRPGTARRAWRARARRPRSPPAGRRCPRAAR